jgi:hypothetical protein
MQAENKSFRAKIMAHNIEKIAHAGALRWGHRPDVSMLVLSPVIMILRKRSGETQQGRLFAASQILVSYREPPFLERITRYEPWRLNLSIRL